MLVFCVQKDITAIYGNFVVASESDGYRLTVRDYDTSSSSASDELADANGMQFTTKDRDNDEENHRNCASDMKGGFWWRHCDDDYRLTAEGSRFKWSDSRLTRASMYVACA